MKTQIISTGKAISGRCLVCARCGAEFSCDLSGDCWCAAENVKLPMPAPGDSGDCLCRACLRAVEAQRRHCGIRPSRHLPAGENPE